MSEQVTVMARAQAKPGEEAYVENVLKELVKPTREESGCEFYRLFSSGEKGIYYFYELWKNSDTLSEHAKSAHITAAQEALKDHLVAPIEVTVVKEVSA